MFSINEPTRDDIWAEAQRLEQPIYYEGKEHVRDPERMLEWSRRAEIAATTLACFADWDTNKLRGDGAAAPVRRRRHGPALRLPPLRLGGTAQRQAAAGPEGDPGGVVRPGPRMTAQLGLSSAGSARDAIRCRWW